MKCNNINVNVNGLELDVFPLFLGDGGLAAEAQESTTDTISFAGNGDGSEINDFRFICINNNNNTVVGNDEEPIPPIPPIPTAGQDLAVTKNDGTVSILFGNGNGTFVAADDVTVGGNGPVAVVVGDFN